VGKESVLDPLPIVSITPFTLQDFPGRVASILWFTGCNFRCPYCHNAEMALGRGVRLPMDQVEAFLRSRRGLVEGIVFSGGECTLNPRMVELAHLVKELGFQLKVDTNGSRPTVVGQLLEQGLVDYWASDFKAPLEAYGEAVGWDRTDAWRESVRLLMDSGASFELRTTTHPDLLDETDVDRMLAELESIGYRGAYCIQHYIDSETLGGVAKPSRRFDPGRLRVPPGIELKLRNFADFEAQRSRCRSA